MRELPPRRDRIALVRIQPKVSWQIYLVCISYAGIFIFAVLWLLLETVVYALLPFIYSKLMSHFAETYVAGWFFFLGALLFLSYEMYKAMKELRGLFMLARANRMSTSKFPWNQFLRISLPQWLQAEEVLYDPSPTSILDRVQGPEVRIEELGQIYQDMIEPAQTHSSMSILITLSHDVTISIVGQNGKMESFALPKASWAAIIALLAIRGEGRGEWTQRDVILKHVYGKNGDAEKARLTTETSRINDKIQEAVKKAETTHGISLEISKADLDIFEQASFDGKPHWRLSPLCEIDECNILTSLYRRVQAAKEGNGIVLSSDELRPACHHLMETIGQGFLAVYQESNGESRIYKGFWPWATEFYITYRNQCIDILEHAARQELSTGKSASSKDERRDALKWAAKLFRWQVQVAIGIIPEAIKAEEALCNCLKLYKRLLAPQNAKTIFKQYEEWIIELDATWQPSEKVVNSWSEIVGYEMSKK